MKQNIDYICDYCGELVFLVTGAEVYPNRIDLASKKFYKCFPCDAYVGCHPGTEMPLGRLAKADLRAAKMRAHNAFDPLWRGKSSKRSRMYKWLAQELGIPPNECHIGMFNIETCDRVVEVCLQAELKMIAEARA